MMGQKGLTEKEPKRRYKTQEKWCVWKEEVVDYLLIAMKNKMRTEEIFLVTWKTVRDLVVWKPVVTLKEPFQWCGKGQAGCV